MNGFFVCVYYLAVVGIASNLIGELLPRQWFHPDHFPFRCMNWEQEGKIYHHLRIRLWKDRLPDMSKLLPRMMPKQLRACETPRQVDRLILETCVAELTHVLLIVAGIGCLLLWPRGGKWISLLWTLGNIPFILIQRYNRPRLSHVADRLDLANQQRGVYVV